MWKWLMRKLPKRVIKRENGIFYKRRRERCHPLGWLMTSRIPTYTTGCKGGTDEEDYEG